MTSRGMDVSAYQETQDWKKLKANGLAFAFAKASEGMHGRDKHFAGHIKGIRSAGLVPGAYHFGWPAQDVLKEIANYTEAVRPYATKGFTHWLDLERYSDGRNYGGKSAGYIRSWATVWVDHVKLAFPGQKVGVYTSGSDLEHEHYPANSDALWYPAYPGTRVDTYLEAEKAARPVPSGHRPLIWQFTSNPATGPNLDLNLCYLTAAELRVWSGLDAPIPAPAKPKYEPFPGGTWFHQGRKSKIVAAMHDRLVAVGCNRYKSSKNKDIIGSGDVASYEAWQRKYNKDHHKGWTGTALKWPPGKETWDALRVPNV